MGTLLKIHELTKIFPGQVALDDVDLEIQTGSTHALVGQNGSGKSTLIKVLCGFHQPTGKSSASYYPQSIKDTPSLDEAIELHLGDGKAAANAGIRFVHQDLGLVDSFSAIENISMGVGYTKRFAGSIDWKADRKRAEEGLASLGFPDIDVNVPVGLLAPSQKTAVAIARALHDWDKGASLLVLDEPTASLPGADVERLFTAVRRLQDKGVAILYVSHHLDEVFEIADTATVLRDGKRIATLPINELDHDKMIELMIGQTLVKRQQVAKDFDRSTNGLQIQGLAGGTLAGIDLHVEPGEIVGVAGIMGSGREMMVPLITGQTPSDQGSVAVDGTQIQNYSPKSALNAGMAFLSADRYSQGVIAIQSVRNNLTLSDVRRHWNSFKLDHKAEKVEADEWIEKLDVKTPTSETPIGSLSGGNQQKVLFGRSLRLEPSVLVLDEPTRGIDVGAKEEIHQLVDQASRDNAAVLVASTDTDELVRLSHRVVVMVNGRISEVLTGDQMTVENIEKAQLQSQEQKMKAGAHGNA
jgi:ribose transport system ATP-binding protein